MFAGHADVFLAMRAMQQAVLTPKAYNRPIQPQKRASQDRQTLSRSVNDRSDGGAPIWPLATDYVKPSPKKTKMCSTNDAGIQHMVKSHQASRCTQDARLHGPGTAPHRHHHNNKDMTSVSNSGILGDSHRSVVVVVHRSVPLLGSSLSAGSAPHVFPQIRTLH